MTQRTVEVIIKVASELFEWGLSLLTDKNKDGRNNNDSAGNSKEK